MCAPTTFIVEFGRLPVGRRFCSRASRRRQWARVCLRALDRFSRLENGGGGGEYWIRISHSRTRSGPEIACPARLVRNMKLLLSLTDVVCIFPSRSSAQRAMREHYHRARRCATIITSSEARSFGHNIEIIWHKIVSHRVLLLSSSSSVLRSLRTFRGWCDIYKYITYNIYDHMRSTYGMRTYVFLRLWFHCLLLPCVVRTRRAVSSSSCVCLLSCSHLLYELYGFRCSYCSCACAL